MAFDPGLQQTPAGEDELCAVVRAAAERGQPLSVEGRGTKRHLGPRGDIATTPLSMRRLDAITFHEPGDLVVSAQAGARLADVQRALLEHGQWLPLDPPFADATLGGILATASAGPRRLAHGTARDFLLGVRVVGASGEITRSGGRVVKNVTGYDLHRLQVGAFGTLGVLLEASFKVSPRPEVSGAMVFPCRDLAAAHGLLLEVWGSSLRPVALEALDRGAAARLARLAPFLPGSEALAIVGIEGTRPIFERHTRALRERAAPDAIAVEGADAERLWTALRDAPREGVEEVSIRVGAKPHDLPALLAAFDARGAGALAIQAHAGTGVARVQVPAPEDAAALARRVVTLHELAARRGGYAVVEAAPPGLAGRARLPFAHAPDPLGKALKARWDPRGILNPGRVVL